MGRISFALAGALVLSTASPAFAQGPPPKALVIVLEDPAGELHPEAVRAAIARELDEAVVLAGDPRAADTAGTLRVRVDGATRKLTMRYDRPEGPVERTIDLPPGAENAERATALLAGNLVRDEGDEVASELRGDANAERAERAKAEAAADVAAEERLGKALAFEDKRSHGWNTAADISEGMGLGLLGGSLAVAIAEPQAQDLSGILLYSSLVFMTGTGLVRGGDFTDLTTTFESGRAAREKPDLLVRDVEQAWWRSAQREARLRRVAGWIGLVAGMGGAAVATWFLTQDQGPAAAFDPSFVGLAIADAALMGVGFLYVLTPGPLESAWNRYKSAPAPSVGSISFVPFAAPLAGGGSVVGVSGRF